MATPVRTNQLRLSRLALERLEDRDQPSVAYALTTNNVLFRFDTETPSFVEKTVQIRGLLPAEVIRAIDFRPSTGQLIGLGVRNNPDDLAGPDEGRLYEIDPTTGTTLRIGSNPFSTDLAEGSVFGMSFNPATGGLRIVNSANQNLRVNANTGALVAVDPDLSFVPPTGGPVVAVAYDQNFAGTPTTTLFGIDFGQDLLVRQGGVNGSPSPNTGIITSVGSLDLTNLSPQVGFDIVVDTATGQSRGFATLTLNNAITGQVQTALFEIDLAQGQASNGLVIGNGSTRFAGLAIVPDTIEVTGADAGGGPHVEVFDAPVTIDPQTGRPTNGPRLGFFAYDAAFRGGVRVATGDVNRDGVPDIITAPGAGGGPHIRVFDGRTGDQLPGLIGSFLAYDPAFLGGIYVASADLNGDGFDDVITGAGSGGGPHVKAFSGVDGSELRSFLAYDASFTGGVRVAAGDLNLDGIPDIVTGAGPGGGPHVIGFSGADLAVITSFMAYALQFTGGVYVTVGRVTADGQVSIITGAGETGVPLVRVWQITSANPLAQPVVSFNVYGQAFRGGVRVGIGGGLGANSQSIIVSGGAGPTQQRVLQFVLLPNNFGRLDVILTHSFFAYDTAFSGGVFVAGGF
jgi:hypothetical protein